MSKLIKSEQLETQILPPIKTYIDTEDAKKADKSYVDTQLANKQNRFILQTTMPTEGDPLAEGMIIGVYNG